VVRGLYRIQGGDPPLVLAEIPRQLASVGVQRDHRRGERRVMPQFWQPRGNPT
jgi:hypothetical protein